MKMIVGVLLLSLLTAAPAAAKHWHDEGKAICIFSPTTCASFAKYDEPRYRSLPPGLAKKFARTGHLPPGWQRKMEPLPVAVERELVVLPSGYRRGYIDGTIIVARRRHRS